MNNKLLNGMCVFASEHCSYCCSTKIRFEKSSKKSIIYFLFYFFLFNLKIIQKSNSIECSSKFVIQNFQPKLTG